MRKPTEVKIIERAENLRIRRTGELGGTDAIGVFVDEQRPQSKHYELRGLLTNYSLNHKNESGSVGGERKSIALGGIETEDSSDVLGEYDW